MLVSIQRYNPEQDVKPVFKDYEIEPDKLPGVMLLDALLYIKSELDPSLGFRRSCQEGVCGSDGMNVNGKNRLACITPLSSLKSPIIVKPLPGMSVIRDLIVDMDGFFANLKKAKPYLINNQPPPAKERLQSPEDRAKLDGLYECILCGCCSSACPSYWWNPDKFLGPAALLQATRFILDSRDDNTRNRLSQLNDAYSVFRCRGIMNCVDVCPKGLNPTKAIGNIKTQIIKQAV